MTKIIFFFFLFFFFFFYFFLSFWTILIIFVYSFICYKNKICWHDVVWLIWLSKRIYSLVINLQNISFYFLFIIIKTCKQFLLWCKCVRTIMPEREREREKKIVLLLIWFVFNLWDDLFVSYFNFVFISLIYIYIYVYSFYINYKCDSFSSSNNTKAASYFSLLLFLFFFCIQFEIMNY